MRTFAVKGNICYSEDRNHLLIVENGYVVCEEGVSQGVFEKLPEKYSRIPCISYEDKLILPGMVDLHVHAPQYPFRGLGMDLELIDWLNTHTFPEEAKYEDAEYAEKAYEIFVEDLMKSTTTRACIFATIHSKATLRLMEMLEERGFCGYVGKVNMDRNSPENLCEKNVEISIKDTEKWIKECSERFSCVKPVLTPRFIPSCSDEMMKKLSVLQKKYNLPVQSHLSENMGEIQWVRELCPNTEFYGEAYDQYEMFGGDTPTVMAHCVHSGQEEMELMKARKVFIAHCPQSNTNLASGVAPVRRYLDMGIPMGLGSDVAAGSSLSILRAMGDAIQCSKLRWRLVDQTLAPLNLEEAFYLATKGGGTFFGNVGSFEAGYAFDAVIMDDTELKHPQKLSVRERLERLIYLADDRHMEAKYIAGRKTRTYGEKRTGA